VSIRRTVLVLAAASAVLAFGACNKDSNVGSDKLKNFESQGGDGALGGTTTTAAPTATTAAPQATAKPAATTTPKAATTQPPVQTTAAPPTTAAASITIKIQGDGQGNAFEPSNTRAYANSTIRFQNVDSGPHQVRSRNGEFQSPNLSSGQSWDFKINLAPGTYEYTDSARPYAVGYLEVLAR
jgi:plastocyanin